MAMRTGKLGTAFSVAVLCVALDAGRADAVRMPTHFASSSLAPHTKLFLLRRVHDLMQWSLEPSVLATVLRSNARHSSVDEIAKIDAEWQAGGQAQLVSDLLANGCAQTLRSLISGPGFQGYREAFVTDADGELICATERTSDYWQADEEKWTHAFNGGQGAIYIGPVLFDESVGLPMIQLAVPIVYDERAVGVLIVGKVVHNLTDTAGSAQPAASAD